MSSTHETGRLHGEEVTNSKSQSRNTHSIIEAPITVHVVLYKTDATSSDMHLDFLLTSDHIRLTRKKPTTSNLAKDSESRSEDKHHKSKLEDGDAAEVRSEHVLGREYVPTWKLTSLMTNVENIRHAISEGEILRGSLVSIADFLDRLPSSTKLASAELGSRREATRNKSSNTAAEPEILTARKDIAAASTKLDEIEAKLRGVQHYLRDSSISLLSGTKATLPPIAVVYLTRLESHDLIQTFLDTVDGVYLNEMHNDASFALGQLEAAKIIKVGETRKALSDLLYAVKKHNQRSNN